jgi:hypothetical protein
MPPSLCGVFVQLRQLEEQQQQRRPSHDDHGAPAPAPAPTRRAPAAQHQHTKSMPAALQHVQVRGDLMDRLNLLESRIRQVSCELGLDSGGGKAVHPQFGLGLGLGSSSSVPAVEDPATWSDSAPVAVVDPAFGGGKVQNKPAAAGGSWSAVEILQRGARQLHRSTSKTNPPIKVSSAPTIHRRRRRQKNLSDRFCTLIDQGFQMREKVLILLFRLFDLKKVNKLKEAKSACEKEKRRAERSKSLTKAERSKSLTSRLWLMVGCKH